MADALGPDGFRLLAPAESLRPGETRCVTVEGRRILLCNLRGEFFAVEAVCSHDGGSLEETRLRGAQIECPRHGARFDVRDGSPQALPALAPIATFPVRVRNGGVEVCLGPWPGAGQPRPG